MKSLDEEFFHIPSDHWISPNTPALYPSALLDTIQVSIETGRICKGNDHLIGTQISKFWKEAGLTQEELGEAVGISGQAVSRWECGGAPDVTLLPMIADKLGVTIDAFFSIAALPTLHWSLLAASFATTVIMLSVPKLFHRQMEHLGAICAQEQSVRGELAKGITVWL